MAGELICAMPHAPGLAASNWTRSLRDPARRRRRSPCCSAPRARAKPRCCACWRAWTGPMPGRHRLPRRRLVRRRARHLPSAATAARRLPVSGLRPVPAPHRGAKTSLSRRAPGRGREFLEAFGLAELAARLPRAISAASSSAWRWRARWPPSPALLLLDEPLSALDAATRARTRQQLRRLLLSSGVPSIVVTHDRMEAVALGDWMAVMVAAASARPARCEDVFQPSRRRPGGRIRGRRKRAAGAHRGPRRRPADARRRRRRTLQSVGSSGETGPVVGLHSRRRCRHHARDVAGFERAQPAGRPGSLSVDLRKARWRAWSWIAAFRWWRSITAQSARRAGIAAGRFRVRRR